MQLKNVILLPGVFLMLVACAPLTPVPTATVTTLRTLDPIT